MINLIFCSLVAEGYSRWQWSLATYGAERDHLFLSNGMFKTSLVYILCIRIWSALTVALVNWISAHKNHGMKVWPIMMIAFHPCEQWCSAFYFIFNRLLKTTWILFGGPLKSLSILCVTVTWISQSR